MATQHPEPVPLPPGVRNYRRLSLWLHTNNHIVTNRSVFPVICGQTTHRARSDSQTKDFCFERNIWVIWNTLKNEMFCQRKCLLALCVGQTDIMTKLGRKRKNYKNQKHNNALKKNQDRNLVGQEHMYLWATYSNSSIMKISSRYQIVRWHCGKHYFTQLEWLLGSVTCIQLYNAGSEKQSGLSY